MNTTFGKILMAGVVALSFLTPLLAEAQTPSPDTTAHFRFGVDVGGGYAYKLSSTNTLPGNYTRGGLAATVRVKWGSHNVFGAGIETGWLPISSLSSSGASTSLGTTNIEASLNAVPLLFVVALQRYNVQLHGGAGYYRVHATAAVFESTIQSSEWDFGYLLALGYAYPLSRTIRVGAEVKWNNISEVQVSLLSLQARVLISLWEW
jgi:opacity protein-like surface antigen